MMAYLQVCNVTLPAQGTSQGALLPQEALKLMDDVTRRAKRNPNAPVRGEAWVIVYPTRGAPTKWGGCLYGQALCFV